MTTIETPDTELAETPEAEAEHKPSDELKELKRLPAGRRKKPAAKKPAATPAKATGPRVTGRDAVTKVLADGQPRKTGEITAAAVKLLRPKPEGKTPEATLSALLYVQAKKPDGFVIATGKGEFRLRGKDEASA